MKDMLLKLDALLSMLEVKGNAVMVLADARKVLGDAYRMATDSATAPSVSPPTAGLALNRSETGPRMGRAELNRAQSLDAPAARSMEAEYAASPAETEDKAV